MMGLMQWVQVLNRPGTNQEVVYMSEVWHENSPSRLLSD